MIVQVKLDDIIEALESVSMENKVFVSQKTGEILYVLNELLSKAEDEEPYDHMVEWQQEMMKLAIQIINNEDLFIEIDSFDINEYDIMEKFCLTITDQEEEEAFLYAIRGKGAFRRFKDMIYELGVADHWFDYRNVAYERLAKDFCDMHNLEYV